MCKIRLPVLLNGIVVVIGLSACAGDESASQLRAGATLSTDITVDISREVEGQPHKKRLLFATPAQVSEIGICETSSTSTSCSKTSNRYYETKLVYGTQNRRFFQATKAATLKDNLILVVAGFDKDGRKVAQRPMMFGEQ